MYDVIAETIKLVLGDTIQISHVDGGIPNGNDFWNYANILSKFLFLTRRKACMKGFWTITFWSWEQFYRWLANLKTNLLWMFFYVVVVGTEMSDIIITHGHKMHQNKIDVLLISQYQYHVVFLFRV